MDIQLSAPPLPAIYPDNTIGALMESPAAVFPPNLPVRERLFEAPSVDLVARAGSMVGVDKDERTDTHWMRSFKFRYPWFQLNLLAWWPPS